MERRVKIQIAGKMTGAEAVQRSELEAPASFRKNTNATAITTPTPTTSPSLASFGIFLDLSIKGSAFYPD